MNAYVLFFQEIDRSLFMVAGGKGANLGELSGIEGILVPDGFCVTTEAYKRLTASDPVLDGLLDALTRLTAAERSPISEICAEIRQVIEGIAIPPDIDAAITSLLSRFSSTTAFAGRQATVHLPG